MSSYQSHHTSHTASPHQNKQSPISPRHDLQPVTSLIKPVTPHSLIKTSSHRSRPDMIYYRAVTGLIKCNHPASSYPNMQSLTSSFTLYPLIKTSSRWSHQSPCILSSKQAVADLMIYNQAATSLIKPVTPYPLIKTSSR